MCFAYRSAIALLLVALATPGWCDDRQRQLLELRSESFLLYSALEEKATRSFATNMEKFDRIISGMSGVRQRQPAGPTRVYLLSPADYGDYFQPSSAVGGFLSDASGVGNDIVIPVTAAAEETYPAVFHEYAHFIQRTQSPGEYPVWFEEGMAEFLSTAQFNERGIKLPAPKGRLDDLSMLPWIPADTFFRADRNSRAYRQHSMAAAFYAQSWLIMHYAFVGNPAFMRQIGDYIVRLNRRESPEESAKAAFGRPLAELDVELRSYARQKAFRDAEIPAPPTASFSDAPVRQLSAGESSRLLAELGIRLGQEKRGLDALLKQALKEMPNDARSLADFAVVTDANGDRNRARELLQAAHEHLTDSDTEAALAIGNAHWKLAVPATSMGDATIAPDALDSSEVRLARDYFDKALRADPANLQAAHGYAQTCFVLGDRFEESAAALSRAQAAAPASWLLAYSAALINERQSQPEAAHSQWQKVLRLAHEGPMRTQAREALGLPNEVRGVPAPELATIDEAVPTTDVVVAATLSRSLNTGLAKVGDEITARTQKPISIAENILLPKDTRLTGRITQVQGASGATKTSMLAFTLDKAVLRDGREIPIRTRLQSFVTPEALARAALLEAPAPGPKTGGGTIPGGAGATAGHGESRRGPGGGTAWTTASSDFGADGDTPIGARIQIIAADSPGVFGTQATLSSDANTTTKPTAVIAASARNIQLDRGTILVLAVEAALSPR